MARLPEFGVATAIGKREPRNNRVKDCKRLVPVLKLTHPRIQTWFA